MLKKRKEKELDIEKEKNVKVEYEPKKKQTKKKKQQNRDSYINEEREVSKKVTYTTFLILAILLILFYSARMSYLASAPETAGETILQQSRHALDLQDWAKLKFFDQTFFKTLFLTSGALVIAVAYMIADIHEKRHYKEGEQYGTAKWMDTKAVKKFNTQFNEPIGSETANSPQNTIYSKNCQLSMNTRHTHLNNNAMIIGGPGSGKSYNVVRPNLLQAYGSYVITDPSGELLATTGNFFKEEGYDIRVFNLVDMPHSHRYNPFAYLRQEQDVVTLIQCLINSTNADAPKGGDPFWEKAETALLEAIIFYLIRYQKKDRQNFSMVSKLVRKARLDPRAARSQLDSVFDEVRHYNPDDICVKQYDIFKQASDKTAQSILITAAVRLSPFNIEAVESLTCADDMDLKSIGDKKTVTYIIVPQGANAYAFLVNMLYSQMFDTLYFHAASDCGGRLKYDTRFILDEFANIGVIPAFQQKLTTMRKYGLSCMIFIQAVGQIKNLYKDDWETLMGACDTLEYLGGNELSSMEDLVKKLGDQTIRVLDNSYSRSAKGGSTSSSFKFAKRSLMTIDELRRMDPLNAIIVIKGQQPFNDPKYDTSTHPNAKRLGNLDAGVNIYRFDYCNTRPESMSRAGAVQANLEKEAMMKSKAQKRAAEKAINANPMPPVDAPAEKTILDKVTKDFAKNTTVPQLDTNGIIKSGGEVVQLRNGKIGSIKNAKTYTIGKKLGGDIASQKRSHDINQDDVMNELEDLYKI